jgi:pimeloyl-ACP methyl ester carboxylesterase
MNTTGGGGETAATPPPYAIEREVEDLAAVIEKGGEPAFVFGQSSGGALALEAAARAVPIRALVVNEPPVTDGPTTEFASLGEARCGRPADRRRSGVSRTLGNAATVVAEMRAAPYWPRMEAFAPTLSHEIRVCNNDMVPTDRLAQVSAATLRSPAETAPHGHTKGREQSRTPCPAAKPECSRDKATASPTTCSFPCSRNSSSYRSR